MKRARSAIVIVAREAAAWLATTALIFGIVVTTVSPAKIHEVSSHVRN